MDYKAACDTIVALQRDLHFHAQKRAGLRGQTTAQKALDATYVLLEFLSMRIKEEELQNA